jgi:hypothetical protein
MATRGSLPDAHAAIVAALTAWRDAEATEVHVYDLWRPDMAFPAVWTWMAPGTVPTPRPDTCTVRQVDRIVVVIGVDPAATITEDVRSLLGYVQAVREALDPVLYPGGIPLGGAATRAGWASGQQFVVDTIGDAQITEAELPIEVTLDRTVNPGP